MFPFSRAKKLLTRVIFGSKSFLSSLLCSAENVYLDPIGSGMIQAATARASGSALTVTLHKDKLSPSDTTDFTGIIYLLSIDLHLIV